jgi:hypothetical protein
MMQRIQQFVVAKEFGGMRGIKGSVVTGFELAVAVAAASVD